PVMLVTPTADRWVLFTVEAGGLDSFQVVHLTGTTKLLELPITERHVPNLWLGGALVNDRQLFTDEKEVVVPPTKNFLTVEVKPDRADYQPRDEGSLLVTTRDDQGKPVSAEVALSLVDESIFYIQPDYAGDPRQFFFGEKRGQQIRTDSSFNQRQFIRLVKSRLGDLRDDRNPEPEEGEAVDLDGEVSRTPKNITAMPASSLADFGESTVLARRYGMIPRLSKMAAANGPRGEMRMDPMAAGATLSLGVPVQFAGRMLSAGAPASLSEPDSEPAVVVRSDFRSTAFWQPDVKTGTDGTARVTLKYPESLTRWQATARAVTRGSQVGWAKASARTRQPLILRLQTPRFLVVGDLAVVSVIINNNTVEPLTLTPKLEVEGVVITGGFSKGEFIKEERGPVTVPANGEVRVNWAVSAQQAGKAKFTVSGRAGKFADAMERVLPVEEHGIEKFLAKSGKATNGDVTVKLDLPARKPGSTRLTVSVTPSMAVTMLDALPYLADYPYGCTEQTLSRFLPATIVRQTLLNLGLDAETAMARTFGGIETNTAAAAQPGGKKDLNQLNAMVAAGLDRLNDFQHADGGWGWWKEGESDAWMTAYVVWGLNLARQAEVKVDNERLRRALIWLEQHLVAAENDPALQAWMLHALAVQHARVKAASAGEFETKALANLWTQRDQLNAYTRSLFALAAHHFGDHEKAAALVRALSNGVIRDDKPDTSVLLTPSPGNAQPSTAPAIVHWGEDGGWWRWSDGGVEATAFALRALLAIDPKNDLVEPAANWLLKNRRGAQWSNTRDTALVILALNDYLRVTGELKADLDYEVVVNGQSIARKKITPADIVSAPSVFSVDAVLVRDANEIRIVRHGGNAPMYFAVQATLFSAEEPVTPAGSELFVKRSYFKLVPRATLLKGTVFDRVPLNDGETVNSGERIETVVTIETKNDYEYLLFEDLKPAGFEAVEVRSGGSLYAREVKRSAAPATSQSAGERDEFTGRTRWVYPEWRDRKAALFIDKLPQGFWELRYEFRAETPGRFHALPVLAHAMYVPEIRANSAEVRVNVGEGK
ncbi:MAG TPA: alpha-2-macroglobulin family protein, partial [Candidatus Limnocylindria bacterium]|nr:alpha-2-macroglobulin family protein [Candidatus Limnocylindria bacterium]